MTCGETDRSSPARRLLPIYKEVERFEALARTIASCSRGCHGCCYQQTGITLAEAVLIVDWAQREPAWQGQLDALRACAEAEAAFLKPLGEDSEAAFMDSKRGCIFLDKARGECRVYPVRPFQCRIYFVTSPPTQCYPDAEDTGVAIVDPRDAIRQVMPWMIAETQEIPLAQGSIGEMVRVAFEFLERTPESFDAWLEPQVNEIQGLGVMSYEQLQARFDKPVPAAFFHESRAERRMRKKAR